MKTSEQRTLNEIPARIDNNEILHLVHYAQEKAGTVYFSLLKYVTNGDDKEISDWLNISEKTFRSYKVSYKINKPSLLEHVIMLITLFKHGQEVFGSSEEFKKWLATKNFYFDKKTPVHFIDTASGIKFIDDRLTGMEYGDNV